MKIAIAVWDLSVSGGTQRQVVELAAELAKKHDVTVYAHTFDPKVCYPELTRTLTIKAVSKDLPQGPSFNPKNPLSKIHFDFYGQFHPLDKHEERFAALIDEEYDVLNIHDYHIEQVAYRYKQHYPSSKVVWMINDMPNTFQLRKDLRPKIRKNLYIYSQQRTLQMAVSWHAKRELKRLQVVDQVVALGKKNQRWIKQYMGLPSIAVASGLDAKKFSPLYKKGNELFTVLAVGILFPVRRYDVLVRAVATLKERGHKVQLNIVGSDRYSPGHAQSLRQLATDLGIKKQVHLLGTVSDDELVKQYRTSDAFVLTSQTQTWGLAPFEAMASGTPVIINQEAGAADWLTAEENALFLPPHSTEAVTDQLERLITDPELRMRLAKDGRTYVENHISWQHYAQTMLKIFQDA